MNRILIVRFSSLGDIILLTPLFREVKKHFPDAELDFMTATTFAAVCSNNPHINRIISFDRSLGFKELKRVASLIKRKRYHLILDAHASLRSRAMLSMVFGPAYALKNHIKSVNKRSWKRNVLLATSINLMRNAVTQREAYCRLLKDVVSNHVFNLETELYPGNRDKARASEIIGNAGIEGKRLIALGPGASFHNKCWPKEYYLALSEKLFHLGFFAVLLGGKTDEEPKWIAKNSISPILNLSGELTFLETAAMLQRCMLSVSNDSAVVHFSESVGTPAIAIFGPTVKEFGYAPFLQRSKLIDISLKCRPCSRNGKGNCHNTIKKQCLKEITVETILSEIERLGNQQVDFS